MPDVSARSLVLIIQAVDREITRLMSLPDDAITPAEERRLVDVESLAHELEEAYASVTRGQTNLPAYEHLVTHRDAGPDPD